MPFEPVVSIGSPVTVGAALPAGWTHPAPGVVARDLAPGIVLRVQDDGQGGINGNGWGWQFSNPAAADPGVPSL
jgi:hypothetical protein